MSGATFTADALLAIGMDRGTTPVIRPLCLAAERADRSGLAMFDAGELLDLVYGGEDSKTIEHVLHLAAKGGVVLPDPAAEEIRLDTSLVRPSGFPEVGARYLESGITSSCGQHRARRRMRQRAKTEKKGIA